ncbi:MAG: TatD family hydrolase [Spirochaetales bacterium]|nr:TatD family hydrolase [Spirochaetales bacterium]
MNQSVRLTDSHCHLLSIVKKGGDIAQVWAEFLAAGGTWLLDVGIREDDVDERIALTSLGPQLRFSCGVHPSETADLPNWDRLVSRFQNPLCVAVGEIGLDWYRGRETESQQLQNFITQLEIAEQVGRPVILHVREAMKEVLTELKRHPRVQGVFHCFSGTPEDAQEALNLGFALSFAGNLTYKSSETLRQALKIVPRESVLFETDAPYLSPVPVRGQRNEPHNVRHTINFASEILKIDPAELCDQTTQNFEKLFAPVLIAGE